MGKERSDEELKEYLEKKISFYESQLGMTLDHVQRGILVGKIEAAKKEIKSLTAKKTNPVIKKRIEDPTLGEKKRRMKEKGSSIPTNDGRGSVIAVGSGTFNFML